MIGVVSAMIVACGERVGSVMSRLYVGNDPATVPMPLTLLSVDGVTADAGATASPATFTYSCF